ncbi:MAG: MOSC domain-containing protein [Thermoproteota archaeon]|nr:MOSC domain-containing protein [Thermoproteota archaeon]
MAKIISLNVGLPQTVSFNGQAVTTGIFKEPVDGRLRLRRLNLDGDKQADLTVHGGPDKAVYAYPSEHYTYWKKRLPNMKLPWGMFGENFTTLELFEDHVNIGDVFRIGSSEVVATQPRMPCYKLGVKFGRMDIVRQFMESKLSGIYFRVLKEGYVKSGDEIKLIGRDENNVTVKDIVRLVSGGGEEATIRRAIHIKALPEAWRQQFLDYLGEQDGIG